MFWGLTPAVDFLELYQRHCPALGDELNILIVGGSDSRHVLQTIARRYRYKKVKLNFFLMEGCVETLARQLLLLYVALQPEKCLGRVQKARIFMELYGNTLSRPSTAKYLCSTAAELVRMVTNFEYMQEMMPNVTVDVKYKERDYLENLLKFWYSDDEFNISLSWDRRLRQLLSVRYDAKLGAFDWDLHMRFRSMGGNQVCNQEYRSFRQNGVAFTWLESEVSRPNRSLACAVIPNGAQMGHCGFMGDMQTGPFVAYGLTCEDGAFLRSTNGRNAHRATDVTERNLQQIFHELEFAEEYRHSSVNDMQLGEAVILQTQNLVVDFKAVRAAGRVAATKCLQLEDVSVKFLSLSLLKLLGRREEYGRLFDVVYFGSTYVKYVDRELLENATAAGALLMVENQRYVLSHRDKELEEFSRSVDDKLCDVRVKKLPFDLKKDDYVQFLLNSDV